MIHAHHFFFADQPALQEEYESFGFERRENDPEAIVVGEIAKHDGFQLRNGLRFLSGRLCHFLSDGAFTDLRGGEEWGLEVVDVLTLVWDAKRRNIYYGRGRNFTPELLRFWVFHTFFPIVLSLERHYKMMHVGAVEIDGGPVLFSAASYGGKSTMTHHFLQKGYPLFSDDTLAIEKAGEHYLAHPSFPYHRPYREPETLGIPFGNFAREPAPVKAIFELKRAAPDAEIVIEPVKGVEKFNILHQSQFIRFRFMKHERFAFALEMARVVPVYHITVPWDLARIDEVYTAIVDEVRGQSGNG